MQLLAVLFSLDATLLLPSPQLLPIDWYFCGKFCIADAVLLLLLQSLSTADATFTVRCSMLLLASLAACLLCGCDYFSSLLLHLKHILSSLLLLSLSFFSSLSSSSSSSLLLAIDPDRMN